jgi:hypothetical protein
VIRKLPDCVEEKLAPCTEQDWAQCQKCYELTCLVHDELLTVRHSGPDPNRGSSRLCKKCIDHGYYRGEIMRGEGYEFIY